jgi:murein L,D-transpeptidase YcbB/YkuD
VNAEWNVDPRDDAPPLDSTVVAIAAAASAKRAIESQRPDHFIYRGLMASLARLDGIAARGGWPTVRSGKTLKPGERDPRIPAIRSRLAIEEDAKGSSPSDSLRYDGPLREAVLRFKARHRLADDDKIDAGTIAAMNVPAGARAAQVRVNLERARWVLAGLGDDFVLVNLPAFKAYRIQGGKNVWEARTQIGEEAMKTPTFRANIRTVVFNPDWTVPPTILAEEVLTGMREDRHYLDRRGWWSTTPRVRRSIREHRLGSATRRTFRTRCASRRATTTRSVG